MKSEEPNNGIQAEKIGYGPNEIKQTYSEEDGISFTDCPVKSTTIRDSDTMAVYPARYPARLDPQEYRYARKKLKKAMQEHYRCVLKQLLSDENVDHYATWFIDTQRTRSPRQLSGEPSGIFFGIHLTL